MRLCGKTNDDTLIAVEVKYVTYDFITTDDGSEHKVNLKIIDVDDDYWYLDNILQVEAEDIIHFLVKYGYIILDEDQILKFEDEDSEDEDSEDEDSEDEDSEDILRLE